MRFNAQTEKGNTRPVRYGLVKRKEPFATIGLASDLIQKDLECWEDSELLGSSHHTGDQLEGMWKHKAYSPVTAQFLSTKQTELRVKLGGVI